MNVIQALSIGNDFLKSNSIKSYIIDSEILLSEVLKIERKDIILNQTIELTSENIDDYKTLLSKRSKQEPIVYLTKKKEFWKHEFVVNKNVLIPRPETEELVQWVIDDNNKNDRKKLIDLGAGSGCIGISISKTISLDVTLADISKEALRVCNMNKDILESNVKIIEYDMNTKFTNDEFFDIIISNPPYLDYSKKDEIDENVNFEPHIALFAPEDNPLHFYKQILVFANKNLNKGGQIYLEINPDFIKEFNSLLTEFKPNDVNFKVDFRGKKRLAKLSF